MSLETLPVLPLLAALAVGALVGLALGRLSARRTAARARRLAAELEAAQEEMTRYRGEVSKHFEETGRLVRDLTLQYRAVYEHLADGARTLCPDGAALLEGAAPPELSASASGEPTGEEADSRQLSFDEELGSEAEPDEEGEPQAPPRAGEPGAEPPPAARTGPA